MSIDSMTIGAVVGFMCSVGFLALGYTLGTHTVSSDTDNKASEYKDKVIDKLIAELKGMKDSIEDSEDKECVI
ncbi:MAG: hypothetical protein J6X45_06650 [Lachnospiraceae bacterium]|nr:hypothetical protein [Lachnospiraceae bacterium]